MNKLASRLLLWQGVVFGTLSISRYVMSLRVVGNERTLYGPLTVFCFALATFTIALSKTRLCGLSPLLSVLASAGLGIGFLIIGFIAQVTLPIIGIIGAGISFVSVVIVIVGVLICKEEPSGRVDKPLRVLSLILAMLVIVRIFIGALSSSLSTMSGGVDLIRNAVFETILLFLSSAGLVLSLIQRGLVTNVVLSYISASAYFAGSIFLSSALSTWYVYGSLGNIITSAIIGLILLLVRLIPHRLSRPS